jgi:hypothetical protein
VLHRRSRSTRAGLCRDGSLAHAHAIIRSIRTREALVVPGVIAVLTATISAGWLKPIPNKTFSWHPRKSR